MTASADPVGGFIIVALLGILYFLPSAAGWKKRNATAIVALNVLLGWTIIGWIVALIWGLTTDAPDPIVQVASPPPRRLPPILCATCGKYSAPGSQFCSSCGGQFIAS
ncbi:MAG: superinfection immunity protein [Candidatus Sulfotelmatobacter sp.]|jgi:hypothetical protein